MTKSCLKHYLTLAGLALISILFWIGIISWAVAAVTWIMQSGNYYKYDTTPTNLTDSIFKYVLTTDIETVRDSWRKENGIYVQCISSGGSNKYWPQGYDCYGKKVQTISCQGFKCVDDFGITYDLTKNTVLQCPMVQIKKGVAVEYDGAQSGTSKCR